MTDAELAEWEARVKAGTLFVTFVPCEVTRKFNRVYRHGKTGAAWA